MSAGSYSINNTRKSVKWEVVPKWAPSIVYRVFDPLKNEILFVNSSDGSVLGRMESPTANEIRRCAYSMGVV